MYSGLVLRLFERKQAVEDGAVVASLLELGSVPELGDRWWLLGRTAGKSNSERWYRGRVVGITLGEHFTVELDDPSAPAHDGKTVQNPACFPAPLPQPPAELVALAARSTRYMPFSRLTVDLLREHVSDDTIFAMSQPLAPGERIDAFISHSWHDEAEAKFAALSHFVPSLGSNTVAIQQFGSIRPASTRRLSLTRSNVYRSFLAHANAWWLLSASRTSRLWCVWDFMRALFADKDAHNLNLSSCRCHLSAIKARSAGICNNLTCQMQLALTRMSNRNSHALSMLPMAAAPFRRRCTTCHAGASELK